MRTLRSIQIVNYLKNRKFCSLKELEKHFDVSPATIHRDVSELAKSNVIQKVHGGVAYGQELALPTIEDKVIPSFAARIEHNVKAKTEIAENAVSLINDGDVLFLDSSTTALYFARKIQTLNFSRLTIITNSILIIQEFYLFPANYYLISLGGNFNGQLNAFLGKTTIDNLKRLWIDKAFISGVGLTAEGLFTYHEGHAEFLKEVLKISQVRCLLLDSSKFGRAGVSNICPMEELNYICSDKIPPEYASKPINVCSAHKE